MSTRYVWYKYGVIAVFRKIRDYISTGNIVGSPYPGHSYLWTPGEQCTFYALIDDGSLIRDDLPGCYLSPTGIKYNGFALDAGGSNTKSFTFIVPEVGETVDITDWLKSLTLPFFIGPKFRETDTSVNRCEELINSDKTILITSRNYGDGKVRLVYVDSSYTAIFTGGVYIQQNTGATYEVTYTDEFKGLSTSDVYTEKSNDDAYNTEIYYIYKGTDSIDPAAIAYSTYSPKGGESITIRVIPTFDGFGGNRDYKYQVQLNGGSWTTLTTTSMTTYSYTIPKGTTTFRARVQAKDDYGFTSADYVTGDILTVINNVAPSTPSSISVPSSVQAGVAFTVSWGASTDSDGNLSGYTLQRSLNGGSYSTIYTGSSRSYQDTIPKSGYSSVSYRVQAYDTDGAASSYKTSNTATVINNVAPVISGSNQNLGTFNYNPPTISYVVTDENNDTVTVTIKLDSSTLETKTVTLGQTYTIPISWWDINTGSHTVTITANDGQGGTATRTYTFTKNSVGQISFNRLHKKTDIGYQTTYIETDSDSIITNNGQILSERLEFIAAKLSVSISTTPTEMVSRHRLHIKLTSEYTIDYLEMYSTNVKVGSNTLEAILTQLESKVGITHSGTVPSDLNFERWRMKNNSGSYDIIYLEGISEHVIRPCGKTVEESLQAIEAKL